MKKLIWFFLVLIMANPLIGQDKHHYVTKKSKYKGAYIFASPLLRGYQTQVVEPVIADTLAVYKWYQQQLVADVPTPDADALTISIANESTVTVDTLLNVYDLEPTSGENVKVVDTLASYSLSTVDEIHDSLSLKEVDTLNMKVVAVDSLAQDSLMHLVIYNLGGIDSDSLYTGDSLLIAEVLAFEGLTDTVQVDLNQKGLRLDSLITMGDSFAFQLITVDSLITDSTLYVIDHPFDNGQVTASADTLAMIDLTTDQLVPDSLTIISNSLALMKILPTPGQPDTLLQVVTYNMPEKPVAVAASTEQLFNPLPGAVTGSTFSEPLNGAPQSVVPRSTIPEVTQRVVPESTMAFAPAVANNNDREVAILEEEIRKQELRNELRALQSAHGEPVSAQIHQENVYLKERLAFEKERQNFYREQLASRDDYRSNIRNSASATKENAEIEKLRRQLLTLEAASTTTQVVQDAGTQRRIEALSAQIEALNAQVVAGQQQVEAPTQDPEINRLRDRINQLEAQLSALDQPVKSEVVLQPVDLQKVNIYFKVGSKSVGMAGKDQLDEVALALKQNQRRTVVLKGYTDSSGDPDRNMELSKQRATAIRDYLIQRAVESQRLRIEYYGADLSYQGANQSYARRVQIDII